MAPAHSSGAKHARHARLGDFQQASTQPVQQSVPSYMGINDISEQEAPRPIGVDPAVTGSFKTIHLDEGARIENRQTIGVLTEGAGVIPNHNYVASKRLNGRRRPHVTRRTQRLRTNRNLFIGLGIAAFLVIAVGGYMLKGALDSALAPKQDTTPVDQTSVSTDSSVSFHGSVYSLAQQSDGKWALVGATEGAGVEGSPIFEIDGTPAGLVLYNDLIIIPENISGDWNVVTYGIGATPEPSTLKDANGTDIGGSSSIASVNLDGSTLTITDSDGNTSTVSLG